MWPINVLKKSLVNSNKKWILEKRKKLTENDIVCLKKLTELNLKYTGNVLGFGLWPLG